MLVLTRKAGESIIIANNVRVKVIEVTPGGVKIGIEAPREVSIVRAEIYEEVEGENRRSLSDGPMPEGLVSRLRKDVDKTESAAPAPASEETVAPGEGEGAGS